MNVIPPYNLKGTHLLKVDDQHGSVLSSHVTALYFLKSGDAHFIMAPSEIGHDMFLCRAFKKTACSSVSLQRPVRLPFNRHFTKVWKDWQGSYYFQTINCSPVLTCCLVGLVIEFFFLFFCLLIGTQSSVLLRKSVWTLCYVLLREPKLMTTCLPH